MRDKEFHDKCAIAALQALIAKIPVREVKPGDDVFRYTAAGAISYATAMVEQRRIARSRWAAWLWWAPFVTEEEESKS